MNEAQQHDTVVILDYGSQYTQLIARRIREAHVYCRIFSWRAKPEQVLACNPKGFVLSGGPSSVYDPGAPTLPSFILDSGRPVLGICYGMQLLAHRLGGEVASTTRREYGPALLLLETNPGPLFRGWGMDSHGGQAGIDPRQVWMSHGDRVNRLPAGFQTMASTGNSPHAAAADLARKYFAVQFHPEVVQTVQGRLVLENFVRDICECKADWTPANFVEEGIDLLRRQIGNGRVILGLSGGVDSAVTAALVHRAVGKQLTCIFVDHGLLRQGEAQKVIETFERGEGATLVAVNAIEEFLEALSGVDDPEQKRAVIGERFIRVFEREARRLGPVDFLAQGTIYPDVIESASHAGAESKTIKTHHNVGGIPEDLNLSLVEPLRFLFKDEVRRVGEQLGLPHKLIWRQPFPGPGLAIRCLGPISWERLERLRAADAVFLDELEKAGQMRHGTQQAFAVLLPVKSVGVMGDNRTYEEVIALRAVVSEDFMTADWSRLPYEVLAETSRRIINEVPGVNRVVYDVTSKPPGTIEWE